MRLLQVNISEFRSITDQKLKADGLVVLFGPNSAGKTSVLEAAEQLIIACREQAVAEFAFEAGGLGDEDGVLDAETGCCLA